MSSILDNLSTKTFYDLLSLPFDRNINNIKNIAINTKNIATNAENISSNTK